jgi:bifunctional N-acetylglucosamine-1-phosphate-uridyltransferase/glucosamine-1-phosphate-acetyltransferase GlmU-like protein
MRPHHKQAVLELLVSSFNTGMPLIVAYSRLKSSNDQVLYERLYWEAVIEEITTNGLSVVICDTSKNDEIVGVNCGLDYTRIAHLYDRLDSHEYF